MSIDADKLRLLEARMVRVRSPGTSREGFGPPADSNSLKSNQNQTSSLASSLSMPIAVLDQNSNGGGMTKIKQLKRSAPKSAIKPTTTKRPRKLQRGSAGSESVSEEGTTTISTSEKNGTAAANDQPMASPSDGSSPNRPRTHDATAAAAAVESPASAARPIDSFFNKKTSAVSSEERTSKKKKTSNSNSSSGVNIPRFVGPSSSSLSSISTITSSASASASSSSSASASASALSSMLPPASVSASERMALVERAKLQTKLHKLEQHVVEVTKHAKQTEEAWSTERKRLQGLVTETRGECNQRVNRAAHALENVLRAKAVSDGIQSHLSLATNSHRLGRVVIQRTSTKSVEMWEDGHVFRDLEIAKTTMSTQKVALDARRKELQNKRRSMNRAQKNILNSDASNDGLLSAGKNTNTSSSSSSSSSSSPSSSTSTSTSSSSTSSSPSSSSSSSTTNVRQMTETEREQHNAFEELSLASEEEALKIAFDDLKNEEKRIDVDILRLDNEKILHIRETKRMRDEDASRFNCRPVLHQRYLLLRLLGRGGFSEVWEGKFEEEEKGKRKKKSLFIYLFCVKVCQSVSNLTF